MNANGQVNLGNATSDTITATGRFDSDLIPHPGNGSNRNLGSNSLQWNNLLIDGTATIDVLDVNGAADFSSGVVANTLKVSDLTNNRVVIAGASGEIEDSNNLTFNGSTLALTGAQTISNTLTVSNSASIGGDLSLSSELNMMGSSSSNKFIDVNIGTNAFHIR